MHRHHAIAVVAAVLVAAAVIYFWSTRKAQAEEPEAGTCSSGRIMGMSCAANASWLVSGWGGRIAGRPWSIGRSDRA